MLATVGLDKLVLIWDGRTFGMPLDSSLVTGDQAKLVAWRQDLS